MPSTIIINTYQDIVQIDEKLRIDCTKTFLHPGDHSIQSMTIEVEGSGDSFDITSNKYLDYAYSTAGDKTITVTVVHTGVGHVNVVKTATLTVKTAAIENLFSNDVDIIPHEPDILNYLPEYKADYRYVHRLAQDRILTELDEKGLRGANDTRLTAAAIVDIEEVNDYSKFKVLQYIFESLSNAIDDIFHEKALRYSDMAKQASNRSVLRLDTTGDAEVDTEVSISSGELTRV